MTRFQNMGATMGAWAFEIIDFVISKLPEPVQIWLVTCLAWLFGHFSIGMRKALRRNLTLLFKPDEATLNRYTDEIFRNFGLTLYDFFHPKGITLDVPDRAKIEALRKPGKGMLVLTFHMGHWELGARTMQEWGWPVTAVFQPYQNKKFKEVIESRRAPGVNFIPVGGAAARGVRDALKKGDIVAMLGDHPFGEAGIEVSLMGHQMRWPKGPVLLAVRENAPIVIAVIIRTGHRRYMALISDPMVAQNKTKAEVHRLVQEVADKFGKLLLQYPTQWYRFRDLDLI